MKILSLDSSTKHFSLAVSSDEKVLAVKDVVLDKILSSSIVPEIDSILKKAKLSLEKLDGFALGLGPGSFTSLRVGFATIKGLAFVTGKPIVGVSSLDILAAQAPDSAQQICSIVDARRNMVYACVYKKVKGVPVRKEAYLLIPVEDLLNKIKGEVFFIGDGLLLFQKVILESSLVKNKKIIPSFAKEDSWYPQAKYLIPLTLKRFEDKKYDNAGKLVPLYLYPEDCQVSR